MTGTAVAIITRAISTRTVTRPAVTREARSAVTTNTAIRTRTTVTRK